MNIKSPSPAVHDPVLAGEPKHSAPVGNQAKDSRGGLPGWSNIATAPLNEVVETKIHDGGGPRNYAHLRRQGNLWFFPDGSMYVYYTPTHWRRATLTTEGRKP